jgi:hypothetical protein
LPKHLQFLQFYCLFSWCCKSEKSLKLMPGEGLPIALVGGALAGVCAFTWYNAWYAFKEAFQAPSR